ncbi:MAG: alpha/beta fold hydrolase [Pseudorhodobacter sp.]|nr:alpha/beta fold hydrolase [Frankiaceae bacterium]
MPVVPAHDTSLYVNDRGPADGLPLLVLHGGPGLDHTEFADYLDPLTEQGVRLLLVDLRAQGRSARDSHPRSWTLEQMASDVSAVAAGLGLSEYAVLGHSYGAFVALQHAVEAPGAALGTVVSSGVASGRWLAAVDAALATFEPEHLRAQVLASWALEASVKTEADVGALMKAQMPFHFADPLDPRIAAYEARVAAAGPRYAPDVLRHFATAEYGGIELVDRRGDVGSPVLVLSGAHDRVCVADAGQEIADGVPGARHHVFAYAGHMTFVEATQEYLQVVGEFLGGLPRG